MVDFFKKIKDCILKEEFGIEIKKETFGNTMKYLFIIVVIIGTVTTIKIGGNMERFSKETVKEIKEEYAEFEFKDGRFIYYGEMPVIRQDNTGVIAIDTTGKSNKDILEKYESGIFISGTEIVWKENSTEKGVYNLSDFKGINFTKNELTESVKKLMIPLTVAVILFGIIWKVITFLLLTVVAEVTGKYFKIELNFKERLKITAYAITLSVIINFVLLMFKVNIPFFFIIYYGITVFYIVRYIKKYKENSEEAI